jgi:hypothetical protein
MGVVLGVAIHRERGYFGTKRHHPRDFFFKGIGILMRERCKKCLCRTVDILQPANRRCFDSCEGREEKEATYCMSSIELQCSFGSAGTPLMLKVSDDPLVALLEVFCVEGVAESLKICCRWCVDDALA